MNGRLFATLRLLRAGTLFSPAADVTASLAVLGLPWDATAVRAVLAGVCLYAAGMVWNDVADRRLDAELRPERPLPSGELSVVFAVVLGSTLLTAGLLASPCRIWHGTMAALVLAYDFALKRIDWLGAIGMATLRGMNLATATALAAAAPDPQAGRALLIAALCYGIYIAAVTVLGIYEDRPSVQPRAVAAVQAAPPLAAMCGLVAVQGGLWPAPVLGLVPAVWFARRNARRVAFDQATIRRAMTQLLLGTMLFSALLAAASNRWIEAAAISVVIVPARWIARSIALT
ncbi:MAG: UbiA family prenyltransferase [Planctomycetes bacterium]|nr:UbiA family prenyltransferase [Planctomycetota bacterium]